MKNKKFFIPLFLLIFLGAAHQMMFSLTPLKEVPALMSAVRAKEFCSCFFMLEKGREYCLESVKKGYPLFEYEIDEENKSITFRNPIAEGKAIVLNQKYGCKLL
jgi:hypothetical protein